MENVTRLSDLLSEIAVDWAVLTAADSVCFATGHVVGIEIGLNPFAGGPSLAFVGRDGSVGIVCANVERQQRKDIAYETYFGFDCAVTDTATNFHQAVAKMVAQLGVSGRLGIERASLPASVTDLLRGELVPIDRDLAQLRAIKTPAEVEKMRAAGQCAAAGQQEARLRSIVGATELDVLNRIRSRMENIAQERCAFAGEYLSGVTRTSTLGLQPNHRALETGDPIVCDLAPRLHGYWGDSCGSFIVNEKPSADYLRMFGAAKETLDLAISEMRPGIKVSAFDKQLRANMQKHGFCYPHHSGHGIGTSVHEFPRLVPNEHTLIQPNMVIMVEPGSYSPEIGGLRCEHMLRVTETGCEVLTPFEINPHIL